MGAPVRSQVEAVENHMPEIVIVDEIGTEAEALACRTIAERGVQLIGTAHGQMLENLIKNPTLSDLIGGICSVTLGMSLPRIVLAQCQLSVDDVLTVMMSGQQCRRRGGKVARHAEEHLGAEGTANLSAGD